MPYFNPYARYWCSQCEEEALVVRLVLESVEVWDKEPGEEYAYMGGEGNDEILEIICDECGQDLEEFEEVDSDA